MALADPECTRLLAERGWLACIRSGNESRDSRAPSLRSFPELQLSLPRAAPPGSSEVAGASSYCDGGRLTLMIVFGISLGLISAQIFSNALS